MFIYRLNRFWLAGFAMAALILIGMSYHHYQDRRTPPNEGGWVEAAPVKRGNIPIEVQAVGSLVAERQIIITSEMAGHIASVLFKDGDFVTQGTALIQLDDKIPRA